MYRVQFGLNQIKLTRYTVRLTIIQINLFFNLLFANFIAEK